MIYNCRVIQNELSIDKHLFRTNSFTINKVLILDSILIKSKSAIKKVLYNSYHEGYFEMTIYENLELNNGRKKEEDKLQRQFNLKVESL